jgi:ABC-type sugar transport system permease subunit
MNVSGLITKLRKKRGLAFRNAVCGYLFIIPFLIGFVVFLAVPLYNSLMMSFSVVGFSAEGFTLTPAGLNNYLRALTLDPLFNRMLLEELQKLGTQVPFIIVLSFFTALILNTKFKLRAFARAAFFLPVILSSGVIASVESNNSLLNSYQAMVEEFSDVGRITDVLETLLVGGMRRYQPVQFVLDAVNGVYTIMMASGIQILIFLAGLQSVPDSMYEAARIEGATAWESFWKITLPMVSSLILVAVVYSVVDTCIRTDSDLYVLIRNTMVGANLDYGYSAAMSWIYFAVIMLVILAAVGILTRVVFYDE